MNNNYRHQVSTTIVLLWLVGIVVAKGFWMTLFSIIPPVGVIVALNWIIFEVVPSLGQFILALKGS